MRIPVVVGLLAAALSVSTVAVAQAPAQTMLATDRYLFVIHGGVLHQFDVATLRLLNQHRLGGGAAAVATMDAIDLPLAEAVEIVEVVEPPPPPESMDLPTATPQQMEGAVNAALKWLADHQDESGKWDCDQFMKHDRAGAVCDGPGNAVHDVGVTGLAVLAMLGAGNTLKAGPYEDSLKRAVEWLRTQQQENGMIGSNASHDFIYDHAIAAYALCEAYGLSKSKALKHSAQQALNYLESHRNPYAVWRYQPRDNDNDTSVTTWAVCALVSGKFFGLEVNPNSLQMAATWYDQVTGKDGRTGYTKAGESSSRKPGEHATRFPVKRNETLTAEGAFARFLLGEDPKEKATFAASLKVLGDKPARWKKGDVDAVYWYFGTYAAFQAGGDLWRTWQPTLLQLIEHQRADGNAAGSWDTVGVWDEDGGRVFVTALYTLALESGARHAKLVR
ncbi:MAG: terpene cyclase/mutase family protein [Planctomycetes bacterium]|nr:terpene cyclase/mutase family protein [Planctomycetota bacterium]